MAGSSLLELDWTPYPKSNLPVQPNGDPGVTNSVFCDLATRKLMSLDLKSACP